ncbi:hypothetical protein [Pseudomonas mangiferae]|uniref:Uncharacterized protein n=1 Tax=Pseudomonas mangiferae TaxID=2593654 RepID=A0A553GUW2_9PSED|nr:hypothetical protein [Pseudomonas mangiferae]TRX73255.1 hypothetical protein FM069_18960 [Pseudomonas mangiferae]
MTDDNATKAPRVRFNWLAFLPLLGVVGYGFAYLIGMAHYQAYARHFNVSVDLFPLTLADTFVSAYVAALNIGMGWYSVLLSAKAWCSTVLLLALLMLEYVYLFNNPGLFKGARMPRWLVGRPHLARIVVALGMALAVSLVLLLMPLVINSILIVPAIMGEEGAVRSIERDARTYAVPCEKAQGKRCVRLLDGEREIARGYVFAASEQRIALILGESTRILPLKDYTLETLIPGVDTSGADSPGVGSPDISSPRVDSPDSSGGTPSTERHR